jgi:hypothetical protein
VVDNGGCSHHVFHRVVGPQKVSGQGGETVAVEFQWCRLWEMKTKKGR